MNEIIRDLVVLIILHLIPVVKILLHIKEL